VGSPGTQHNSSPYSLLQERRSGTLRRVHLVRQVLPSMTMKEAADELTFTKFYQPSLSRPASRIGPLHRLS
jgi:hypothetical protein